MARRYSPDHKYLILRLVKDAFKGDVTATASYARIPERNLCDWLHAARMQAMYHKARVEHQRPEKSQHPPKRSL
jgi:hypothetical protein